MKNQGLISFLVYLIVIGIIWFAILPQGKEIASLSSSRGDLAQATASANLLNTTVTKLYKAYPAEFVKASDYLNATPPLEKLTQADIFAELQSMASLASVVVESVDVDTSYNAHRQDSQKATTGLIQVPVKISVSGNYLGLKQFLEMMESNLPLFDGHDVSLTGSASDQSYKLQATFYAYGIK